MNKLIAKITFVIGIAALIATGISWSHNAHEWLGHAIVTVIVTGAVGGSLYNIVRGK